MSLTELIDSLILALAQRRPVTKLPPASRASVSSGVFLGDSWPLDAAHFGPGEPLFLPESDLRRHLYVLGASGSGKTNLLVQLLNREVAAGRSIVLIDLRGDLVQRVLIRLAHHAVDPSRVRLLDLRDDAHVMPFNPLAGSGEVHARAFHTLGVLRSQSESWGVQLEETLRNSLVLLTETGASLVDLEGLLLDDNARSILLQHVTDPLAASFFSRYNELSKERRLAWALPVLNKVTPLLAVPRIRSMLAGPDTLDLSQTLDTPGSILLVSLAVDRFHAAAHLVGGLLVSALRSAIMERASVPEARRNPVTLFVDEFEAMASDAFLEILAEGRRFGLSLVLSHQNLAQISPKLKAGLQTNAHLHLYFQTGAADAQEVSREIVAEFPRDDVRSLLMSLSAGEAVLVRRGDEGRLVKTPLSRDPTVHRATLDALVRASYAQWLPSKPTSPRPPAQGLRSEATWEVRDET